MSKQIFYYDPSTHAYTHTELIDETQQVPANATVIKPVDDMGNGLLDPTWNGSAWAPMTETDFINKHKDNDTTGTYTPTILPTGQDKTIATLTIQLTESQKTNITQSQQIASLTAELLTLTKNAVK